jgi:hypothetical protein
VPGEWPWHALNSDVQADVHVTGNGQWLLWKQPRAQRTFQADVEQEECMVISLVQSGEQHSWHGQSPAAESMC